MSHHKSILDGYTLNWIKRHKSAKTIIKLPMSKSRRKFLRQIFDGFDEDGGGDIDFGEFRKAVQFADPRATYEQAFQLFKSIDLDDGGTIDFEEFCHGMERKEAEDANDKKLQADSKKDHSKEDDNLHHIAVDHQRSSQLDAINSDKIRDTLKIKSFRALFKTHALTFPSNNEDDEEVARAEKKAHLSHVRLRREHGTKGTERFGRKNKERMRQCIIGVTVNLDEHLEPYGLVHDDFDDIVAKPLTLLNFKASLAKIDSLHPHEAKLNHGGNLHILVVDSSEIAANLHGKMLAAVGHHIAYQDGIIEDQVISGQFDILLTSTLCLNGISKKPIVRHIRDHEREQVRKLTEAQEAFMSKQKKAELNAANMIKNHSISFPNTHVTEDKSSTYASSIKKQSFAAAKSVKEERKFVDNEILANIGLRKSRSCDSLSSSATAACTPSLLMKIEERQSVLASTNTCKIGKTSPELQTALAEINDTASSLEARPGTAESNNSSVVSQSRPGTAQSRPRTSESLPTDVSPTRVGRSESMNSRPGTVSPVQFVPDISSMHTSPSVTTMIQSVPSSHFTSSSSSLSPNVYTSEISSSLSPSITLLRPINVIHKRRNTMNSHSRRTSPPIVGERTRLLTNSATLEQSKSGTIPIIKLPSSITRRSNNNTSSPGHGGRGNLAGKLSRNRKVKSDDNLEKMARVSSYT